MKSTEARKRLTILIFGLCGLIISIGINALINGGRVSADEKHSPFMDGVPAVGVLTPGGGIDKVRPLAAAAGDPSPAVAPRTVVLKRDQAARIGKADIIYRGLESGSKIRIDVVIPEFDPQVAYPYRLNIGEAKKGFRLAHRKYRLISAHKAYTHLYLLN